MSEPELVTLEPDVVTLEPDVVTLEPDVVTLEPGSARWWAERAAVAGRRRPRVGGLSTTRIVEASLEVLRDGGIEALTVRAVADRLDTSSASLYRHIASRDELIALIVDHVMGDVRLERTGRGWRDDVEALMREVRRVILNQPLPPSEGKSRSAYGPNMLRMADFALGLFLEAGLTHEQAAYTTIAMIKFVASSANIRLSAADRRASRVNRSAGLTLLLDGLPADHLTSLRAVGDVYASASADDVFTHGVAVFLDGVASQIAGGSSPC